MGRIGILVAVCVLLFPSLGAALAAETPSSAVRLQPVAVPGQLGARPALRTTAETPQVGPILRILQRRRMGATLRNVKRIIDEMRADGSLDKYVSINEDGREVVNVSALAVEIVGKLAVANPGDWWEDIDWEALIELIIQLIMLIFTFF